MIRELDHGSRDARIYTQVDCGAAVRDRYVIEVSIGFDQED